MNMRIQENTISLTRLLSAITIAVMMMVGGISSAIAADDQAFVEKKYGIQGSWGIVEEGGKTLIRFSKQFSTKSGPDLKVFLSPLTIDAVTGKTATEGSLLLGVLESNNGTQDYLVPEGVSLEDFASVLVHCEKYSVLWGGGDLAAAAAAL